MHLTDIYFKRDLYRVVLRKLLNDLPHIYVDWLKDNFLLEKIIHCLVDIFLNEVNRGHIFCDDLFDSVFYKYIWSDFPFKCSKNLPCIICCDFCLHYITHLYELIKKLYEIDLITDSITQQAILNGRDLSKILISAMLQSQSEVVKQMEATKALTYLSTINNLHDIIRL